MTAKAKLIVTNHLSTSYAEEMIAIHGLAYVKKEIFHAIKNQDGDARKTKNYNV